MDACETGDLPSSWLLCGVVMVQGKLWLGRETSGLGRLWRAGGLSWAGIELREELVDWRGAIRACKVCYAEQSVQETLWELVLWIYKLQLEHMPGFVVGRRSDEHQIYFRQLDSKAHGKNSL